MFSRATKLMVRSLGPRQFHIGEQNFKNVFIGGTGEISRTLSQLLKNSTKLNVLALYDLTAVNKPLPNQNRTRNYCDQTLMPIRSKNTNEKYSKDTNEKKSRSTEGNSSVIAINNAKKIGDSSILNFFNRQANNGKREIKELMEALYRLPIAEGVPTLNSSSMSNEITSKAGNARSGLRPHARLLDEIGPNGTRTRQRDCAAIRKWLPGLTCSPFQGYVNFITATETSRRHLPIKDKIGNSARDASDAEENNCRSLPSTSLNDDGKSATRLTKKFNNTEIFSDAKTRRGTKTSTSRLMLETLLNNKSKCLREICGQSEGFCGWLPIRTFVSVTNGSIPINRGDDRFWGRSRIEDFQDNTIIYDIVKEETQIQRTSFREESMLSNPYAQIRSRSTTVLDSFNWGNIPAVNEALAVSVYDALPARTILFASKDCDLKSNIRRKLEKICAAWNRFRRRGDRDDICEKRQKSCKTAKETCREKKEVHRGKTADCSARRERMCEKQTTVLCSGRKSSSCGDKDRDRCKTRKEKCSQKQRHKDDGSCRAKMDSCGKHHRAEPTLCKRQDSKEAPCRKTEEDKFGKSADKDALCKQKEEQEMCQKRKKVSCEEKKEEVRPDMKKECLPVKKAPGCSEDHGREKDR